MSNRPDTKPCGCPSQGLTRAFALWQCAGCGHVQRAPRSSRARCAGCGRAKGANPQGFGHCGADWPETASHCGECGHAFEACELGRLPHPEVEYLTETDSRGYFRARDSFLRCCGCLELAPNGMD